jgi:hypothetical protein
VRNTPTFAARLGLLLGLIVLAACGGRIQSIEPIVDEDPPPEVPDPDPTPALVCDGVPGIQGPLIIRAATDAEVLDGAICVDGDLILDGVEASTLAFGSLQRIAGDLVVGGSPGLESLSMPNLRTVDGEVLTINDDFAGNPSLRELDLPLLETAAGLRVVANPALANLTLTELAVVDGPLAIVETLQLEELVLPRLAEVHGDLNIPLNGAVRLSLPELETVSGNVIVSAIDTIEDSDTLEEIDAPTLRVIEGDLFLGGNTLLTSLSLPALEIVGGRLTLNGNHSLPLVDLPSLQEIEGNLSVRFDASIEDILVPALTRVGGDLTIRSNDQLPGCRATELGDSLNVEGAVDIGDNRGGCDCTVEPVACQ